MRESQIDPTIVAQLKSNNDDAAFARLGANSSGARKKRKIETVDKEITDFRAEKKGWTISQRNAYDAKKKEYVDIIRSPEFQKQPGFQSKAFEKIKELKDIADITTTTAAYANKLENSYEKDDHDLLEGYDDFAEVYNPAFGMTPSTDGKSRYIDINELNAHMDGRARNVQQVFEYEYEVPDYGWSSEINEFERGDGKEGETKRFSLPENKRKLLESDAIEKLVSGLSSLAGKAEYRNKEDETFAKNVEAYIENTPAYQTKMNSFAGDQEKIAAFKKSKAIEYWETKSLENYKEVNKVKLKNERSKKKGKYDPGDYRVTTENFSTSSIDVDGRDISMGSGERPVSAVPKARVNVSYDGQQTEGDIQKIFLDTNNKKVVLVNVKVKSDGRSQLSTNLKSIPVPYEEIRGELGREELDLYDAKYEEMAKIGVKTSGMNEKQAADFEVKVEKVRDGVGNQSKAAKALVKEAFGEAATKAGDPTWDSNDIEFTIGDKKYSFNLDELKEKEEFLNLVSERKNKSTNKGSTGGAY